jgi:SAM-dependent methyltransferase
MVTPLRGARPSRVPNLNLPSAEQLHTWALAYLRHAPMSLTLREVNRLVAVEALGPVDGTTLDVGCGDGYWWTLRQQDGNDVYGIDISAREIAQAKLRINAELTDVSAEQPFPAQRFAQIIGNCSLEHVPNIDGALGNLRKSAAPNARLVMFVPTPRWAYQGRLQSLLLKHTPRLAMTLSGAMNGFFQHWHLYDQQVWRSLLAQNGWRVDSVMGLGSQRSEFLFRMFMPPAFVQFVAKKITGHYPAKLYKYLPDAALSPLAKLVSWAVNDPLVPPDSPHAYEYMIIASCAEIPAK